MEATRFFRVAVRLACYGGAVASRLRLDLPGATPAPAPAVAPAVVDTGHEDLGPLINGIRAPKGAKVVSFAEMAAQNPDLISFQRVAG